MPDQQMPDQPSTQQPSTQQPPTDRTTSPHVPEHLAGWYPGDLASARRAHAEHEPAADGPAGPPVARTPAEDAPPEGGRFLAAWYAGDLGAAVTAHEAHEREGAVVRLGRTRG